MAIETHGPARPLPGRGSRAQACLAGALFAFVAVLALYSSPGYAAPEERGYIVVLEDSVAHPHNVAERHAANHDATVGSVYRSALKGYAAEMTPSAAEAVARDPAVAYVEPDAPGHAEEQRIPNGAKRILAPGNSTLDIDETDDIRAEVDVAVLDTGIAEHEDLEVSGWTDCTVVAETCIENEVEDEDGHGTHVAGIIGAIDNGFGVVGVAPGARLWSVKVLDAEGNGELSEYIAGVDWATAHAKAIEVVNSSVGYEAESSKALEKALKAEAEVGIVNVVAAGNEKTNAGKFALSKNPEVLTVSAIADYDGSAGLEASPLWVPECGPEKLSPGEELVGPDDYSYTYSNYGTVVDVTAPGVCIDSTWLSGSYEWETGTSMATAYASGAAAILASHSNPNTAEDVEEIRFEIAHNGNLTDWTDTSGDGVKEPLLDISNEEIFQLN